jgi:EpsI family protein
LTPDSGWSWTSAGPATADAKSERLMAGGKIERLALTWYRSGDLLSGSNAKLKLANIGDRLLLRAQPTAMLILSAEQRQGFDAAKALTAFQAAIGDPGPWMDRIAEAR